MSLRSRCDLNDELRPPMLLIEHTYRPKKRRQLHRRGGPQVCPKRQGKRGDWHDCFTAMASRRKKNLQQRAAFVGDTRLLFVQTMSGKPICTKHLQRPRAADLRSRQLV